MKYRNLKLSFCIEGIEFTVLSICLEKLLSPMPMHSHSKNSYEIHYVSYGYGTLYTEEKTYEITPGTLFVTGPGVEHEQLSVPENPMTEYCVYLKIRNCNKDKKKRMGTGNEMMDLFLEHPFWFGTGDSSVHELFRQMLQELEARQQGYDIVLQSLLQQLLVRLVRSYETTNLTVSPGSAPGISAGDLTYLIIEEAFLYHYRSITLEELAGLVGLGRRQTERVLQVHYHKTFSQKKTEARMSAALSLLRDSKQSISGIADQLGYSSAEHFSNAFKRYYKQTPSGYRRTCLSPDLRE